MSLETLIVALASAGIGSLTLFLVWINWRLLRISQSLLGINIKLLKETIIIRVETIKISEYSYKVLDETRLLRETLGDVPPPENMNLMTTEYEASPLVEK